MFFTMLSSIVWLELTNGYRTYRADRTGEISSSEGRWGEWGEKRYCNDGQYAIGFRLKVEGWQESADDTAANSFSLLCGEYGSESVKEEIYASNSGDWGDWSEEVKCSGGNHITGFISKVEPALGGGGNDDTALNSIKIKCSDGGYKEPLDAGEWGNWGRLGECGGDEYVCGFKIKVEGPQGGGVGDDDDTAMNALKLQCCSSKVDFSDIQGYWYEEAYCSGCSMREVWIQTGLISSITATKTSTYESTLGYKITAGFDFLAKAEIEISASVSASVSDSVSETITQSTVKTVKYQCDQTYIYQFRMSGEESIGAASGDFTLQTNKFKCTDTADPQCPPDFCADAACQRCTYDDSHNTIQLTLGKCLDVHKPDENTNGGNVQIWDCSSGSNQNWYIEGNHIKTPHGKCLDVHADDYWDNGANVQIWDCNGRDNQKWSFNGREIRINNGKCLDVHADDKNNNGGNVQIWDCNGNDNQQWNY